MRVLITGGAGCLGSNLLEYYLPRGIDVMVIDNFVTGRREVLPDMANLEVVSGSIEDAALVDACFAKFQPTHVIHAAASYKDPDDWRTDSAVNVGGTVNVVRAAEKYGVQRIVYFQTALCFGRPESVPIPATAKCAPFTSYGISKTAGENYLFLGKVPAVSLRLANVTGPRLAIGPIPTFYKRLKEGKGCFCSDTMRDFLDMSDFLTLMDKVMDPEAPTGKFNVSTGVGHKIREIFDLVAEYLALKPEEPPTVPCGSDDVPAVVLDPLETERAFDWKAVKSFRDTIFGMLEWYDAHGVSAIYSHLKSKQG